MRTHKLIFILILLIGLLVVANAAFAEVATFGASEQIVSGKLFISVDKLRPGDSFELAMKSTVKEGYHIGAADKDALYPARLTIAAPKGIKFAKPIYPPAERKAFKIAPNDKIPVYEGEFIIRVKGKVAQNAKPGKITITATLDTQGCKDEECFPPETIESKIKVDIAARGTKIAPINKDIFTAGGSTDAAGAMADKLANMNVFSRFAWLYIGGLLLAFTPCVYPMVPITVGYFSNQAGAKKRKVMMLAGAYVLGLALTYSVLGAIAATTGGMFGAAMQSPSVLAIIAVVLVGLALSMFGLYELQAPSFIQSRASGKAGILGALVMGLVFGIVAAPCVGPMVLGLLLLVAKMGSPAMGFLLFFALALGLGTPLFVLATFSARMPVPGMWMVAVKKFAGFLLLGAAAYFVKPIVPEAIGKLLIPAVVLAAGIYLGCFEKSLHSNKVTACASKAFCIAALVLATTLAIPGLHVNSAEQSIKWEPYSEESLIKATQAGKPIMVDFTAQWCAACKELEHGPFSDPRIIKAVEGFSRFRVDGTNRNDPTMLAAVKKYAVKGFPTVLFFDKSGNEVKSARVLGYIDPDEMMKRIESVAK